MPTIQEFESLLAAKADLWPAAYARQLSIQAEYEAEVLRLYRLAHPSSRVRDLGKMKAKLGLSFAEGDPVYAPFRLRLVALGDALVADRDRIEAELVAMAAGLDIPTTETPELRHTARHDTYRSQGYGANSYARGEADRKAAHAQRQGVEAVVRVTRSERGTGTWAIQVEEYGVFANTTATGWEIVTRRPGLPLREWLAACWKAGTNPRVLNPYLPHGLEERLGVTYFGDLVEPAKPVVAAAS